MPILNKAAEIGHSFFKAIAYRMGEAEPFAPSFGSVLGVDASAGDRIWIYSSHILTAVAIGAKFLNQFDGKIAMTERAFLIPFSCLLLPLQGFIYAASLPTE